MLNLVPIHETEVLEHFFACISHTIQYTDDVQLWYHWLELNVGPPPWPRFVQLVNKRFGPPLTDSPIDEITLLRRDSSIDDFVKRFMALSCRDTMITKAHQVQLFLAGLRKPLRTDVALHRPPMLDGAIMLARAYEQRETPLSPPAPHQHSVARLNQPAGFRHWRRASRLRGLADPRRGGSAPQGWAIFPL
jgi:hypothetical protein